MGFSEAHPAVAPTGRVKATGRIGQIIQHDPDDKDLTYKLSFADGQIPEVDWFGLDAVEVQAAGEALPAGEAPPRADSGEKPELPQWAASRPVGTPVADEGFICAGSKAPLCPPSARSPASWAAARPAGTPVADEHFICMGSKAPQCPPPQPQAATGPITLEVLQGEWQGSGGASIVVAGTDVYMNGMILKDHKVELREDGTVCSIGRLWQLDRWAPCGRGVEFRASSTREGMESARLEVWSRKSTDAAWSEKMRLMGYAGSSADVLGRGVEGCMPGTDGIEAPLGFNQAKDREEVRLLSTLVNQWREPGMHKIISAKVVPDATNRAQTGLGIELVHFVAHSMQEKGFKKRQGTDGHDIPVVVREPPSSATHKEALSLWKQRVAEEEGFPPVRASEDEEIFTSLGNGHFFQALNCFACQHEAINHPGHRYTIGEDTALAEAIKDGVPGIVLKHEVPRPVRAKIAALLNSKREFFWTLNEDGTVNTENMEENTSYCSQFEWLSKGMDAVQVDCLVRTHLRIHDSKRIMG